LRNEIHQSRVIQPAPVLVFDAAAAGPANRCNYPAKHRDKAAVESIVDTFEDAHPDVRVVRLRPGLIFKAEAASGIRRLFAGRCCRASSCTVA